MQIYIDGEFYSEEDAKISVFDHGLLYGDGVFEGIRVYDGRVFELDAHIDRLYASAQTIALEIPLSRAELIEAMMETIRRNELDDGYVRLVVTRGMGDLGLNPAKCPKATVFCIADGITLYPAEVYEKGFKVVDPAPRGATTRRPSIRPSRASTTSTTSSAPSSCAAPACNEGLFLTTGRATCASAPPTTSSWCKGRRLMTPQPGAGRPARHHPGRGHEAGRGAWAWRWRRASTRSTTSTPPTRPS